jgi:glycosyltransferase involved in cell wall biosynthesis
VPNETPRFSILITNFNYATFVGQAIRSALDQNYPADRFQVVVVDDGSTDGSRQVIESFSADPRLLAIFQTNRGQSAAFETGLLATDGDYVCLLDSDDLFLPDKLTRVAARLQQLGLAHDRVLLCHDLFIENSIAGHMTTQSWFDVVGISRLPDQWTLNDPVQSFPFSVPCGLVFSRAVMASVLAAMPTWAFPRGTDGVLCPAAFLQVGSVHYLREKNWGCTASTGEMNLRIWSTMSTFPN